MHKFTIFNGRKETTVFLTLYRQTKQNVGVFETEMWVYLASNIKYPNIQKTCFFFFFLRETEEVTDLP